jgi:plasmid maintenance system antidote protein VapI
MEMHNPVHPGRLIRVAMGKGLTVSALAKHLGVTRAHMSMIVNDGFWWQAQSGYELAKARRLKRKKLSSLKKQSFSGPTELSLARPLKQPAKAESRNLKKAA